MLPSSKHPFFSNFKYIRNFHFFKDSMVSIINVPSMAFNSKAGLKLLLSSVNVLIECCCFPLIMYAHVSSLAVLKLSPVTNDDAICLTACQLAIIFCIVSANSCWWFSVVHDQRCFCVT